MSPPSVKSFLPAAIFLSIAGLAGLGYLFIYTLPTMGPRWLYFFFSVLAVTGVILPVAAFLNQRFPTEPPAQRGAVLREASIAGVYFATISWLQLGRVLTLGLGLLLAGGLVLVEFLIRLRERSRWEP
jgi:hypothetical protein